MKRERRCAHAATHEVEIGGLQGAVIDQVIAKRGHHAPILARVGIGDLSDLRSRDRPAWIGEQRGMQCTLGDACVRRWRKLRSREISLEKLVGHEQAAAVVTVKQVMPTRQPEILHSVSLDERSPTFYTTASQS